MAKGKYYVVWEGRNRGVFSTWVQCKKEVDGYSGARFRSFPSKKEAEHAFQKGQPDASEQNKNNGTFHRDGIELNSISVDVGCRGNPGIVEYRGVDTKTGEVLFEHGEISMGTNNMGEFLAIVHGLAYLKERGETKPIYSDSVTAMNWVKQKKANSTLERTEETAYIWSLMDRAEKWLKMNEFENELLKWQTDKWGEIKADYGRK